MQTSSMTQTCHFQSVQSKFRRSNHKTQLKESREPKPSRFSMSLQSSAGTVILVLAQLFCGALCTSKTVEHGYNEETNVFTSVRVTGFVHLTLAKTLFTVCVVTPVFGPLIDKCLSFRHLSRAFLRARSGSADRTRACCSDTESVCMCVVTFG